MRVVAVPSVGQRVALGVENPFSDLPLSQRIDSPAASWVARNAARRDLSLAEIHLVELVCDALWRGPYDLRGWGSLEPYGTEGASVALTLPGGLATIDTDRLTRLVVLAHDRALRVEVTPHTFSALRFTAHMRRTRSGSLCERVPTLEAATATVRSRPWR